MDIEQKTKQNIFKCSDCEIYLPELWLSVDQRMLKLIVLHTHTFASFEFGW